MANTLAELVELKMAVDACCEPCNRYRRLDLPGLIERLGGRVRIDEVRAKLVCSACGRHGQRTLMRAPGTY